MHLTLATTDQTFVNGTGADQVLVTTIEGSAYLFIQNNTSADVKLKWAGATGTNADIVLVAGDVLEYFAKYYMPVGALHMNATTGEPVTFIHK